DGRGILTLTFFNQLWRKDELKAGVRGIFAGKVGEYRGARQLTHPDYQLFEPDAATDVESARAWAEQPIPIYPATASVASWQVQKAIGVVLDTLPKLPDPVPDAIRQERTLMSYSRAVELIHRPQKEIEWRAAQKALRFQDDLVVQSALLEQRNPRSAHAAVPRQRKADRFLERFA